MSELPTPDLASSSTFLNTADSLFAQQTEWTLEERGTKLGKIDAVSELRDNLPSLLRQHAENIDFHPSDTVVNNTVEFLDRTLWNSPLPPININDFTRQIVTSQASGGEVPLALQQIACLNYMLVARPVPYGERYDMEILPISNDQPKKRWRRFLEEERDFLLGLTEIGVRPIVAFGVSDVLDFENEEDFSHVGEDLASAVSQNRKTMNEGIEALDSSFATMLIPNPSLRPGLRIFHHSEVLEGSHKQTFDANVHTLEEQPQAIENLRQWLFKQFPRIYERSRQDPNHQTRLTKMLALYATDNQLAEELLGQMFPGESIDAATSVSLQPPQVWEWIEEKVGCSLLGIPITQISPFPNAGNWHGKAEAAGPYSIRSAHGLQGLKPQAAFLRLMREADISILPEIIPSDLPGEEIMRLKTEEVRKLMTATFGEEHAASAEATYRRRKSPQHT